MDSRYSRLFKILNGKVEAVVIANGHDNLIDHNFRYFVGAHSGIFEGSAALVSKRGVSVFTSPLEAPALAGLDVNTTVVSNSSDMQSKLAKALSRFDTIGMNFPALTHTSFMTVKRAFRGRIYDCSTEIAKCRAVKDEREIASISKSCRIASRVVERIPEMLAEGVTERKLSALISKALYDEGSEAPSFPPIVSFGKTSAIPHYSPGDLRLRKGQFVLTDFGGTYRRYCSDITRTFVYGRADERQKRLYQTVLNAQKAGISAIRSGARESAVDAEARKVIDSGEFKGSFIHSLGHGLGLQVHDGLPTLSPSSSGTLGEGMVVTVEPGAYISGYGGVRIEDDVVVRKSGARVLTDAPRELIEC